MENSPEGAPPSPKGHPRRELLEYQKRWVDDGSRWKFGLMSRQVGKDFSAAYEGVQDCLLREVLGKKTDWLIVAPSERQSLESLSKWKVWAEAFKVITVGWEEQRPAGREGLAQIRHDHVSGRQPGDRRAGKARHGARLQRECIID